MFLTHPLADLRVRLEQPVFNAHSPAWSTETKCMSVRRSYVVEFKSTLNDTSKKVLAPFSDVGAVRGSHGILRRGSHGILRTAESTGFARYTQDS